MALLDFTERDVMALKEIARRVLGGTINFGRGRPATEQWEDHQSPEVYVAKTPSGGIPALTVGGTGTGTGDFDEPGSATCDIYCVDETDTIPDLRDIDIDAIVYNTFSAAIAGSVYILVARDKFGHWVACSDGSAGGTRTRFKLKTALTASSSATAYVVSAVGGVLVATATEITVHDWMGISGVAGTLGLAEYWSDKTRWEVYQLMCAASDSGTGTGTP